MPGLTIHTNPAKAAAAASAARNSNNPSPSSSAQGAATQAPATQRTSSPTRPPVSPITPPQQPQLQSANIPPIPDFALGRPAFTHTQPDQVGIAPPPAEPIAFDSNPDVLALKSAISILQLQRARATADMQALSQAKAAALADPTSFVADLAAGRVSTSGDALLFPGAVTQASSSDEDSEGEEGQVGAGGSEKRKGKQKKDDAAWTKLPKPQTVVRCPPINWAQYGVVGESLDKLHAEQVAAPTLGTPMALGSGGTYEFKAGDLPPGAGEPGRRLVGIAAPYTPGRDKIEKKGKGGRR
ncbi:hypothetical protein OQA88_6751 [Cercophora sp. LCS_1]